jgi:hypothetical protein
MIHIIHPTRTTHETNSLLETEQPNRKIRLAAAGRAMLGFCICLALAAGCGTAFGVVLGSTMVWRALMTR